MKKTLAFLLIALLNLAPLSFHSAYAGSKKLTIDIVSVEQYQLGEETCFRIRWKLDGVMQDEWETSTRETAKSDKRFIESVILSMVATKGEDATGKKISVDFDKQNSAIEGSIP